MRLPIADTSEGDGSPPPFDRVAVIGYGLIGGSLGLAVKARWPSVHVIAVDRTEVIEAALRMGAADAGGDHLVLAAEAQLIILAAPVRANIRILGELAGHVPGEALVTDVGSTKRDTVAAARALPARLTFVGGHPLAGAAIGGLESARSDLFAGRSWMLTPGASESGQPVSIPPALRTLIEAVGATPHELTPDAHDRLAAYISHLPQLAASALMHVVGAQVGEDGLAFAGRGLRDTTRLASSPPGVWRDILATNPDHIGDAIDDLVGTLLRMKAQAGGAENLTHAFDSAARWKRALEQHFEAP